ncbi:glycosyltransferase family 1 protein [Salinicola halophyticus]|uniref:glycosyltransferase family 1 protein n=1 Tax=Salinicola halophyticus TaxID=1808881 RepID=UPI00165FD7FF|nr:glycosyltransferase family 1 protein [Salinicola halophyticus]
MKPYLPCRWLVLSDGAHPTEDIYFSDVAKWLSSCGYRSAYVDTREISPWRYWPWQGYAWHRANVLVTRSLKEPWLGWLERHREWFGEIYYLLDDDLLAAARDLSVPEEYRLRMRDLVCNIQPRLFALADEVVVCSETLATVTRHHHSRVSVLTPSLISELPDHDHHRRIRRDIGFHGTRAHIGDLEAITSAIQAVHEHYPQSDFEIMLGDNTPDSLKSLERVECPTALKWREFLDYQRGRRLHIGLAPLWPSAFNRGKSWIKVLDIAVMGGVGIYSARSPYSDVVTDGQDGLLVEDDPLAWQSALERLLDYPSDTERMAKAAGKTAADIGNAVQAQEFWWQRTKG